MGCVHPRKQIERPRYDPCPSRLVTGAETRTVVPVEILIEGMVHSEQNVYTDYADPRRTEWIVKIQPALKQPKLEILTEACGKRLSRREIIELRAGRKKPHRRTQQLLESILKRLGFL
jgi:hypothetical protein